MKKCTLSYNGKKNRGEERRKKGKVKPCAAANRGAALYQHSQLQSVLLTKSSVQGFLGEARAVKKKAELPSLVIYTQIK